MKRYSVILPIAGYACLEVEAESEKEALDAAMDAVTTDDIEEWEALEQIVEGNVFHGNQNKFEIELIEDCEGDNG